MELLNKFMEEVRSKFRGKPSSIACDCVKILPIILSNEV